MWLFVLWFKANRWCNKMEKNQPSWGRKGGDKQQPLIVMPLGMIQWARFLVSCLSQRGIKEVTSSDEQVSIFSVLWRGEETRKMEKWRLFLRRAFQTEKVLLECRNLISHLRRCRESPVGVIFTAQDKDAEKQFLSPFARRLSSWMTGMRARMSQVCLFVYLA